MRVLAWLLLMLATPVSAGFLVADEPREWSFPADHAAHPGYQTEWWYFTGHVQDLERRTLGFELTFFRFALTDEVVASTSEWRARDLIVAHLAVTDVDGQRFLLDERVQRAAAGLAGASTERMDVWAGPWRAEFRDGTFRIDAQGEGLGLDLELTPLKPPVLHGPGGVSRKTDAGDASYYYSMPRLATRGRIRVGDEERIVDGDTWMDHEFFSHRNPQEGLGWDWFSVRLEDGRDLMLYLVRSPEGGAFRFGTVVEVDGTSRPLDITGMTLTPGERWTSPDTGATYPVTWRIDVPAEALVLETRALMDEQEILAEASVGFAYWEGLTRFTGTFAGEAIAGHGYVELTGY